MIRAHLIYRSLEPLTHAVLGVILFIKLSTQQ
jgi:hypothetical protein